MSIKIFDAHTDILFDCYNAYLNNDSNRFKNYHDKQLKNNVEGGIWTVYSSYDFDLLKALKKSKELVDLKNYKVILGIEGLRNLKSVNDLDEIYNLGYRHMMLTWNEENKYATGIKGDINRGLTKKGYEVLDFMIKNDMIIDLSHLNEKSFYDVINYTNKNIICSHSNIKELYNHPRNLTKDQLVKLKEANGLLGLTLVGGFLSDKDNFKTLDEFFKHLKYAINIMSIDNVCFGFDFMDYFNYDKTANLEEVKSANDLNYFIKRLKEEGYSDKDINKLTYENIYNRFKRHIIKK